MRLALLDRQGHDIVIKVKSPLLLSLGQLVHYQLLQSLRELKYLVLGQGDGKEVTLILLPWWKLELQDIIQLHSSLGHHILQFVEVQILELLDLGVVVEGAVVYADDPLG